MAESVTMRPIDRAGLIPYYYQLQEILKEEIEAGRWAPGDLIPSEGELASIFGVSRTVIRKALDILEGDGQVIRVKGKGTIVARPKFRYDAIATAQEWSKGSVANPSLLKVIDVRRVPVGGHVGRVLSIPPTSEVVELSFVQSVDDSPASLSQMYLRMDASPGLADLDLNNELSPPLVEGGPEALTQLSALYGLSITTSHVTVEATVVNEFEAEVLGVRPKTPVFLLSSVDSGTDGTPVAFTRTVARSDHFRFSVMIKHDSERRPSMSEGVQRPVRRPDQEWR